MTDHPAQRTGIIPTVLEQGRLISGAEGSHDNPEEAEMESADFDQMMTQSRAALDTIAKGSPAGYKALYSHTSDITLGNPFGGFARGWEEVVEQLERAASHYRDGETTGFETITKLVLADVAYTVEIERFTAKVGGRPELSSLALRVTCIYRRDDQGWKLVHRHADPRVSRQPAESVLQDEVAAEP
jgi:ketosteroid isomerase-like protein